MHRIGADARRERRIGPGWVERTLECRQARRRALSAADGARGGPAGRPDRPSRVPGQTVTDSSDSTRRGIEPDTDGDDVASVSPSLRRLYASRSVEWRSTSPSEWIANGGSRGRLAPRTRDTYEDLLRGPLAQFHDLALSAVTTAEVRSWYTRTGKALAKAAKARGGSGAERLRLAYVLLRAIMATAVSDGLVASNPCQIKAAGSAKTAERPHLAPEALGVIVEGMPEWSHLPIRVMFGGHLRLGELVALPRRDFDAGVLTVERQVVTVGRETMTTPTKTGDARTVRLPGGIAFQLSSNLLSPGTPRGPMFTRPDGKPVTAGMLQRAFRASARAAGLGEFHLHDVRHSGLTLAAQMGGTTRELMARAGHRTSRAALIYQHAAEERSQVLADLWTRLLRGALGRASGTGMARRAIGATVDEPVRVPEIPSDQVFPRGAGCGT